MTDLQCQAADPGLKACVPFRFACHRCGNCCSGGRGFVWLAPGETSSLAGALGLSEETFIERYVGRAIDPRTGEPGLLLREDSNGGDAGGRCVLLEGTHTCRAYDARPAQCREFPYWPSVLTDARAFEAARSTCPGIAVEASPSMKERAFARLAELYADVGAGDGAQPSRPSGACCLEGTAARELFATALEADYAIAAGASDPPRGSGTGCLLGRARPLGCRLARDELRASDEGGASQGGDWQSGTLARTRASFFQRLRSIERELGYPTAYGRITELLRARGLPPGRGEVEA